MSVSIVPDRSPLADVRASWHRVSYAIHLDSHHRRGGFPEFCQRCLDLDAEALAEEAEQELAP